jgi:hypothetical protein
MWVLLIAAIAILFGMLKYRETFVVKYGNPVNDEDLLSFDVDAKGTRAFGVTPDTCPANKPELEDGLCYESCDEGYHGVGPLCWADSQNIGIGKIPDKRNCGYYQENESWKRCRDDGTSLWEDFSCRTYCDGNWSWSDGGFCHTSCNGCGCIRKNLFDRQYCQDGGDVVAALCYNKCPKELPNRIPGMPYLCFKGTRGLSYGRGVGDVPPLFTFS